MEEIILMIFQGCNLARELESNLPYFANQPNILLRNCNEIIRIFGNARDRINSQMIGGGVEREENYVVGGAVHQQWQSYDTHQEFVELPESSEFEGTVGSNLAGREMEWWRDGGREEVQPMNVVDSNSGRGSLPQRTRRRNEDAENRTVRVPAPRMGNTEIPPEDGYTWRKYGQKEIYGSKFPRGYYRCTHQKLYQCPAKKQVQRLDHDPFTFEVKYRSQHTCTLSSTAPSSSVPPPNLQIDPAATATAGGQPPPSASVPVGHWLSMDLRSSPTSAEAGTSSTNAFVGPAGLSMVRSGRDSDHYYQPVVEYADVMFNSGSSGNSNMDLIFSADNLEKWDTKGEKKI